MNASNFRTAIAALLAATVMVATENSATADVILRDHITTTSLWNGVGGFGHFDHSGSNNNDSVGATDFEGNGGNLLTFSGIFYKTANGVPNGGDWNDFDFRFVFYNSSAAYAADPFHGSYEHVFSQPANGNWLTPVGQWGQFDLFRFDFDLASLGVATVDGGYHLATVLPWGNGGVEGVAFMSFSTGVGGAIGSELDWYRNNTLGWGPATFDSLGAPYDYTATRITATSVPTPGALALMLTGLPFVCRRKRR